jgi:hypothetical protein
VYLSGNYSALGTGMKSSQDWGAAEIPMTKTGTNTWTLTIPAAAGSTFQYKFDLGNWTNVEETGSCGFVNNRTFGFGASGSSFPANDTVGACGGPGGGGGGADGQRRPVPPSAAAALALSCCSCLAGYSSADPKLLSW